MSNEQTVTTIGRLTDAVELRFTPSGSPVANFTIATNARTFNKQTNEWKDEPATFWRCTAWRELAENIAESLGKGDAVVAHGIIKSRSYEKDGQKRTVTGQEITAIGPDLRWATARPQRVALNSQGAPQTAAPAADPWATPAPGNDWATNTSEAPF